MPVGIVAETEGDHGKANPGTPFGNGPPAATVAIVEIIGKDPAARVAPGHIAPVIAIDTAIDRDVAPIGNGRHNRVTGPRSGAQIEVRSHLRTLLSGRHGCGSQKGGDGQRCCEMSHGFLLLNCLLPNCAPNHAARPMFRIFLIGRHALPGSGTGPQAT